MQNSFILLKTMLQFKMVEAKMTKCSAGSGAKATPSNNVKKIYIRCLIGVSKQHLVTELRMNY